MIYFVTFCLSGFFFQMAKYVKKSYIKKILNAIALMLPVFLAAFRGIDVGKDTSYYAYPVYNAAKTFNRFSDFIGYDGIEPAFLLLEYIGSKYLNSFAFVLGTIQFIIDFCFYKVIKKNYGENYLAINMMIFYFLIYGGTLNAIRQSVAIGLILLATTYFVEKNYFYAVLLLILGIMFHTTAIITLFFWVIYALSDKDKICKMINILIVAFSFVLNVGWKSIFSTIFGYVTIWGSNYSDYLIYGGVGERNETNIICGVIALIIIYFVYRKSETKWNKLLISLTLIFIFYQPIGEKLNVAARILLYPQAFLIMIYPQVRQIVHFRIGNKNSQWVNGFLIFLFFAAIWYYTVIVHNSNSILPYSFML